jgi:hypothetical protein
MWRIVRRGFVILDEIAQHRIFFIIRRVSKESDGALPGSFFNFLGDVQQALIRQPMVPAKALS